MSLSLYELAILTFMRGLAIAGRYLDTAAADAEARKIEPSVFSRRGLHPI